MLAWEKEMLEGLTDEWQTIAEIHRKVRQPKTSVAYQLRRAFLNKLIASELRDQDCGQGGNKLIRFYRKGEPWKGNCAECAEKQLEIDLLFKRLKKNDKDLAELAEYRAIQSIKDWKESLKREAVE